MAERLSPQWQSIRIKLHAHCSVVQGHAFNSSDAHPIYYRVRGGRRWMKVDPDYWQEAFRLLVEQHGHYEGRVEGVHSGQWGDGLTLRLERSKSNASCPPHPHRGRLLAARARRADQQSR